MYINKCGVRKIWQKELADCKTYKDQINKLKSILEDLGVEGKMMIQGLRSITENLSTGKGRPTLEKCQKVKAERELQAEIASLDKSNILADERSSRRRGMKRQRRIILSDDEDGDENDKDEESAPKVKYWRTVCLEISEGS